MTTEPTIHLTGFIVLVTVLGISAHWLAWRFRLPAILLFSLAGLAVGPGLGLINPGEQLGALLNPLLGLLVAVILFEGGMSLRFHELKEAGPGVTRLGTAGVAITWFIGSIAAHFVGGLSWPVAVLFGAIIIVTGPTVIMPMLRQARLRKRPASLLKWEGIINDPVGALLAVLVFEYFLYLGSGAALSQVLSGLATALAAAASLGVGGGYLLGKAFSRDAGRGSPPPDCGADSRKTGGPPFSLKTSCLSGGRRSPTTTCRPLTIIARKSIRRQSFGSDYVADCLGLSPCRSCQPTETLVHS